MRGWEGFNIRAFQALTLLDGREGRRVSQSEIGRRVGEEMDREPFTQPTVSGWFRTDGTGSIPEVGVQEALAAVLGVRAGWLAFGEGPASGESTLPSSLDPPLPDAVAGANHLRAAQRAEHEAAVAKRKRRKKRG
jgi:transcriptional regulator with XRE-family HTH domain